MGTRLNAAAQGMVKAKEEAQSRLARRRKGRRASQSTVHLPHYLFEEIQDDASASPMQRAIALFRRTISHLKPKHS